MSTGSLSALLQLSSLQSQLQSYLLLCSCTCHLFCLRVFAKTDSPAWNKLSIQVSAHIGKDFPDLKRSKTVHTSVPSNLPCFDFFLVLTYRILSVSLLTIYCLFPSTLHQNISTVKTWILFVQVTKYLSAV